MLDLLSSRQTVFVESVFKMNIKFCCYLCAVLLWFIDTIFFNVWQSLSLSFCFWPLFLLADDVLPWCVYDFITLETAALDTPNKLAIFVTDVPAKHAPTILPLWKSETSPILRYSHTNCYWTQSVKQWHWHYTAQTNKIITKDTPNVLSVQPTQTLFLYCLVFQLFVHPL